MNSMTGPVRPQTADGAPALSPMKRALIAIEDLQARVAAYEAASVAPIAVIGLACRVPGADDADAFWRLLRDGVDAVGPLPPGRPGFEPDGPATDSAIPQAGYLQDVTGFDAAFFGIAPREANGMDPQQRLALEVAWEALEDAGIAPDRLERSATGVFLGLCSSDYAFLQVKAGDPSLLDAHFTSGIAHSVASGRVSYLLGLQGPSLTVDTACSSSLVSVHLACQSLRAGESRMALAGGVNLMLWPGIFGAFAQSRMLAPDGRCKTFDAAADGFARGEGCGMVVLKRLSDAQADGDRVLAVIRGNAVNQDGPSSGLTAPNGPAQEAVIRRALQGAGVRPDEVGYIEAHGTGTQLGDPLEMRALGGVFGANPARVPLLVGSVKTNIGHLEGAAGIVGLIKLVLALQHRQIPAHLHFRTPSPHIPWDELPIQVPTALQPWMPIGGRRIGGISSFGYSGTNAHLVIEEAPPPAERVDAVPAQSSRRTQVYVLSARDDAALRELALRHVRAIESMAQVSLADLCLSAQVGRAALAERAALVANDVPQLCRQLRALAAGEPTDGLQRHRLARRDPPKIAFVFTGQGAQYAGMGRLLYEAAPAFQAAIDRCAAILAPHLDVPLTSLMFDPAMAGALDATARTQPALFALEYAMAEWWRSLGVTPFAVIGHSVGEYVAACVADVFALEDALPLIALRGRLMQQLPAGGAMAAVGALWAEVAAAIAPFEREVAIAAINAPLQTVVSGAAARVDHLCAEFEQRGWRCQRLTVSHAFHSPLMDPMLAQFGQAVARVQINPPRLRLISNVTGMPADGVELGTPQYWTRHAREAVRFADGLRSLAALRPDICLEIGPHPTLLPLVRANMDSQDLRTINSLRKGSDDWSQMQAGLASLFLEGAEVDWRALHGGSAARPIVLPTYPFQRERHWFHAAASAGRSPPRGRPTGHPLLGTRLRSAAPGRIYESRLSATTPDYVVQHRVHDRVVMPATAYLDLLQAAACDLFGASSPGEVEIGDVVVQQAMLLDERPDASRTVQFVVATVTDTGAAGVLSSQADADDQDAGGDTWTTHVSASLRRMSAPASTDAGENVDLARVRAQYTREVVAGRFYDDLAARGLAFGEAFRSVKSLWCSEEPAGHAFGEVELCDTLRAQQGDYLMHPVLLDGCLQVLAGALSPDGDGDLFLPIAIGRYRLLQRPGLRCFAQVTARPHVSSQTRSADLRVLDADGRLIAELQEVSLKRVSRATLERLADPGDGDPLYMLKWQTEDPPAQAGPPPSLQVPALARAAAAVLGGLQQRHGLAAYDHFMPGLERLCAEFTCRALVQLGWAPAVGEPVDVAALAERLGVASRHRQLFARLLLWLERGGWLVREAIRSNPEQEARLRVARPLDGMDPDASLARLRLAHPSGSAEIEMTGRSGSQLAEALQGRCDPLQLLFPAGSIDMAERVYRDSPPARVFNGLMAEVVAQALDMAAAQAPAGRPLRILELGAGTGGTTAHVVQRLVSDAAVEYTFSDVGPLFVARAEERFGRHPFMRFQVLDLEQDPVAQGFTASHYDLILATNVIHATRKLADTLARVRGLLRPGGCLALLEATAPQAWFDLTVGLTEGWWCFEDRDLRPDYATLPRDRWCGLLAQCGFEAVEAIAGEPAAPGALGLNTLLLARRSADAPRHWLVWADHGGVADAVALRLQARGDYCTLVYRDTLPSAGSTGLALDAKDPLAPRRLLERLRDAEPPVDGVLHLWSLDIARWEAATAADVDQAGRIGVLSALHLVQALLGEPAPPRLWLVSQGSQPIDEGGRLQPAQAPIWGLGKALALEHPELRTVCLDIEPAEAIGPPMSPAALDQLLAELDRSGDEPQVALYGSRRAVPRIRRLQASESPLDARPAPAWRLRPTQSGSLDGFGFEPVARTQPAAGWVEIAVEATGLNFKDVMNVLGMYPGDPGPLGGECAGRIVAVGAGVEHLKVGDDVLALAGGSFASHVCAQAQFVQPRPPGMSAEEGASVAIAYLTAEFCLDHLAALRAGERVLIHAAAGGVGLAAVRLALAAGAEVYVTAGSPAKREMLRSMGVARVMDSRSATFAEELQSLGTAMDVVLNSLSGEMLDASFRVLAAGGRFVEIGKRGIKSAQWVASLGRGIQYHVVDWGETAVTRPDLIGRMMARLVDRMRTGELAPLPRHVFAIDDASRAFRFMAQARHSGRIVVSHRAADDRLSAQVRGDGTYLVTGGLGGLGLLVGRWLAQRGAGRVVLVGRRGVTPEVVPLLNELGALGSTVVAESLDISDAEALQGLLNRLRSDGPPLRGVIHSAGVLADAGLLLQDAGRFTRVFAPKVQGAYLLDRLTRSDPLDWFVLFSSMASVVGSAGQSNHSAANHFLDALACERRSRGLPGLSINWGPWSGTGAAVDRGVDLRGGSQGMDALSPEQGLQALAHLLDAGVAQAMVVQADWPRFIEQRMRGAIPAILRGLATPANAAGRSKLPAGPAKPASPAADPSTSLRSRLAEAAPARQRLIMGGFVREQALRALGMDTSRAMDPRTPLGDMGLDSLLAVELRNSLGTALGRPLPATLLFDYPTLDTLTDHLLGEMLGRRDAPRPAAEAPLPVSGLVGSIEDLSDEEVERQLAARARRTAG